MSYVKKTFFIVKGQITDIQETSVIRICSSDILTFVEE